MGKKTEFKCCTLKVKENMAIWGWAALPQKAGSSELTSKVVLATPWAAGTEGQQMVLKQVIWKGDILDTRVQDLRDSHI